MDLIVQQRQPVSDTKTALGETQAKLTAGCLGRDGELGPADLLASEEVADRLDRSQLKVQIRLKVELHRH